MLRAAELVTAEAIRVLLPRVRQVRMRRSNLAGARDAFLGNFDPALGVVDLRLRVLQRFGCALVLGLGHAQIVARRSCLARLVGFLALLRSLTRLTRRVLAMRDRAH